MIPMRRDILLNKKLIILSLLVGNASMTAGAPNPYSVISNPSIITSIIPSTTKDSINIDYQNELCFYNTLNPYLKEFYVNLGFKYEDIQKVIQEIHRQKFLSQNFFINHKILKKIFDDDNTARAFFKTVYDLSKDIPSILDNVKQTAPEKIKNFISPYLKKITAGIPENIKKSPTKKENFERILNGMVSGEFCPLMYSQLYFILVLEKMLARVMDIDACGKLSKDEVKYIFLKDIVSIIEVFRNVKTKMDSKTLMDEFNQMINKRTKLLLKATSDLFQSHQNIYYRISWTKIMNIHFENESRLSTLQKLFRAKVEAFESENKKIGGSLEVINLIIDTSKIRNFFDRVNKVILDTCKTVKRSYFENKMNFETKIVQHDSTRISLKKTLGGKNYVLNMIFFTKGDETNNDIFLYDVRSDYVLNVYKVLNSIKFKSNYDAEIERLIVWTLTDEYDSRLNIDMIKENEDINVTDILYDVLKGLSYLEEQGIFYSKIDINDVVVCNATDSMTKKVYKKYKLDLRRAFRVDEREIEVFEKDLTYYHNKSIQDFMSLFQYIIENTNAIFDDLESFIQFSNEKDNLGRLPRFTELLSALPGISKVS